MSGRTVAELSFGDAQFRPDFFLIPLSPDKLLASPPAPRHTRADNMIELLRKVCANRADRWLAWEPAAVKWAEGPDLRIG